MPQKLFIGFPHDLLKPFDWRRHKDSKMLSAEVREVLSKYKVSCFLPDHGREEPRSLKQVIEGHHETEGWKGLWALADRLAAAVARLKVEYDYWHEEQENPFLIKVYGEKSWPPEERRKLCSKIFQLLEQYAEDESKHAEALRKINELLTFFPSDSRFPFIGLKTHHQLTDVLRLNPAIIEKCRDKEPKIELYLARISLSEPEFHRLKKMREFFELRLKLITFARSMLEDYHPIQVGDDVYVVLASPYQVDTLKGSLLKASLEAGLGVDLEIFMWPLKREYRLFVVDGEQSELVSLGSHEEWEYRPESHTEWVRILEGDYEYVAWISMRPREDKVSRKIDMEKIAKEFLDWAEEELKRRYDKIRKPVENPISQPISLSPELLLSIVEGYDEFVEDCARLVNPEKPKENIAIRSFSQTIMLKGLNEPSEGLKLYLNLAGKKAKLHMPAILTVIVSKPKYPFWRILELLKQEEEDNITFVRGEKVTTLKDFHVKIVYQLNLPQLLSKESKTQFYKLVSTASRDEREVLKLKIRGLAQQNKLKSKQTAEALCKLIDFIAKNSKNDDERRKTTYEIFKVLRMFTKSRG